MKHMTVFTITAASLLAIAPLVVDSGQGKEGGTKNQAQQAGQASGQAQHPQTHHEQTHSKERMHYEQQNVSGEREIYGSELMSAAERDRYRDQLRMQTSDAEREQFQLQHEQAMQWRAREQGKDLVPPGQGPVYGGELMTVQERNAYREQLRHIDSDEERARFEARHRQKMDQRAMALNLDIDEAR
jgi:hypothetical protein